MTPITRATAALPVMYKMRVALGELPPPAWVAAFHRATLATHGDEPTTTVVGDAIIFACPPEHVAEMDAHIDRWIAAANADPDVLAASKTVPHAAGAPHAAPALPAAPHP